MQPADLVCGSKHVRFALSSAPSKRCACCDDARVAMRQLDVGNEPRPIPASVAEASSTHQINPLRATYVRLCLSKGTFGAEDETVSGIILCGRCDKFEREDEGQRSDRGRRGPLRVALFFVRVKFRVGWTGEREARPCDPPSPLNSTYLFETALSMPLDGHAM